MPSDPDDRALILVGLGALGRIAADIARRTGRPIAGALDDTRQPGDMVEGIPVIGGFAEMDRADARDRHAFLVCLSNGAARMRCLQRLERAGKTVGSLCHPATDISPSARLADGHFINGFSSIFPGAVCGAGLILDNHASIGVDCAIDDAVFVGPGAQVCRNVRIGAGSFVGAGAVILPEVTLGARVQVAAGTTVRRSVPDDMTVMGDRTVPNRAMDRPIPRSER